MTPRRVIRSVIGVLCIATLYGAAARGAGLREVLAPIAAFWLDDAPPVAELIPADTIYLPTGPGSRGVIDAVEYPNGARGAFGGVAEDLAIALEGRGIGHNRELAVYFQDTLLGYLAPDPGPQPGVTVFHLPATALAEGYDNVLEIRPTGLGDGQWRVTRIHIDPVGSRSTELGLPVVGNAEWTPTAVRKVLHALCYGGRASDSQIRTWADMPPRSAIREMLTLDRENLKLSPRAGDYRIPASAGTMEGFIDFMSRPGSRTPVRPFDRAQFRDGDRFFDIWPRMAIAWGLNPCRQRIGFWETNYHMATNLETTVTPRQMARYYDTIMNALADGLPYQRVIALAARSAAVAEQYQHLHNAWDPATNTFHGNEDFAREIHQLFFGILGEADPMGQIHHEEVTIKNTALALTDMPVPVAASGHPGVEVAFGSASHYPGPLHILNQDVHGHDARQRIDTIAEIAIEHPESLANLPVMIISGLMDDELSPEETAAVRLAWAAMAEKNLLDFLRAYAISTWFHREDRVRYATSFDRYITQAGRLSLNNAEALRVFLDFRPTGFEFDSVQVFEPSHNVFGGQRPGEAADSSGIFRQSHDNATVRHQTFERTACATCDNGRSWQRDWSTVIPADGSGVFRTGDVARWLWNHLFADGLANYGPLERALLVALVGGGRDLPLLRAVLQWRIDNGLPTDVDSVLDEPDQTAPLDVEPYATLLRSPVPDPDLVAPALAALIGQLADRPLPLDDPDPERKSAANARIGMAVNVLSSLPFNFVQVGR